jgi:type VI secretion system secreted protein Hcp
MAVDMFLKIDGIDGESSDKDHKDWIEVLSFSWGVHNTASSSSSGGGTGRATAEDFTFTHKVDKATPNLMLACATGKHLPNAQLTVRKSGSDKGEFLKIKLSDCFITSVAPEFLKEDTDFPGESFAVNFAKLDVTETAIDGSITEITFDFGSST